MGGAVRCQPFDEHRGLIAPQKRWAAMFDNLRLPAWQTQLRGLAAWSCLISVEVLHGIARTLFLAPAVGDFRARQIAVFTGSLLILVVTALLIRWIRPDSAGDAVGVGVAWLLLTLAFEIGFGRYVAHAAWSRIASDYNVLRGGLLPIGLGVLTAAPFITAKFRHLL
jgi:hypothetical protein